MPQKFYSTKSPGRFVDLKEAVLRSLPADNGLYMPEHIEPLSTSFWENWRGLSLPEIGFELAKAIFRDSVPEKQLEKIVHQSANFPAPLVTSESSQV